MTTDSGALTALGREKYVRLTTFRRDGTPVATAVWVAPDEADPGVLWVTTAASTGKVRRLGHDPRVLVVACDARGRVVPGAPEVEAVADVLTDGAATAAASRRISRKYPLGARVAGVALSARALLGRLRGRPAQRAAALRLTAAAG